MENLSTEKQETPLLMHAIRFGAIMGVISIVLTLLFYVIDYTFLADWKILLVFIVIILGFTIYAGIHYRNEVGGFLGYGKAFQHGFILMAVGGLISTIFLILLYHVIDTELPQKITDVSLENAEKMMAGFGAKAEDIDKKIDEMRTDLPANYTVFGQLKGYLWALIMYAVLSAITSIFVKKNQPETF